MKKALVCLAEKTRCGTFKQVYIVCFQKYLKVASGFVDIIRDQGLVFRKDSWEGIYIRQVQMTRAQGNHV